MSCVGMNFNEFNFSFFCPPEFFISRGKFKGVSSRFKLLEGGTFSL